METSRAPSALIDRLALPALVLDALGRIRAVNAAFARLLGIEARTLSGSALAARLVDPAAALAVRALAPGAASTAAWHGGDGAPRHLALSLAERGAEGDVLVAFDLTERRLAERRLEEGMARYQDMTRAASDWFFELDGTMTRLRLLRHAGDGRLELLEQQRRWPDEVIDLTYDLDAFAAVIRKMLAREPVRDYIHRQRDENGGERFLRSGGVPYYDAGGVFQGYRGVSVDVTAQVVAERALRESEARLRRSQQHLEQAQRVAATGSIERDLVSGVAEWSDEMYRLLGCDRAVVAPDDETIFALVHEEDLARVREAATPGRERGAPHAGEFRIRRPDGAVRTLYGETAIARDATGRPVRSMAVFRDVTELRAAEARQRDMERQLLQAQKLEAVGTLAGGIAHDLNNTLVPVLALTKLVAERLPLDSRERKNLATVIRASERARELIQQILAFSRQEEAEREEVDLAQVVRDALLMLRTSIPQAIAIAERVGPVPGVFGDGAKLSQVVVNLVTNAAQAIGAGGGCITVELALVEVEHAVRLSVADTGCGMDAAVMARIFEPFFTTKGVGKGSGLGLSVVHGIVKSHGGRLEVKSCVGEGTCFSVYLPLAGKPRAAADAAD